AARLAELGNRLVGVLVPEPKLVLELLVRDLDAELVCDSVEHELARDRLARLGAQALDELVAGAAGDLEYCVERDFAALESEGEPLEERTCSRLAELTRLLHLRCLSGLASV